MEGPQIPTMRSGLDSCGASLNVKASIAALLAAFVFVALKDASEYATHRKRAVEAEDVAMALKAQALLGHGPQVQRIMQRLIDFERGDDDVRLDGDGPDDDSEIGAIAASLAPEFRRMALVVDERRLPEAVSERAQLLYEALLDAAEESEAVRTGDAARVECDCAACKKMEEGATLWRSWAPSTVMEIFLYEEVESMCAECEFDDDEEETSDEDEEDASTMGDPSPADGA